MKSQFSVMFAVVAVASAVPAIAQQAEAPVLIKADRYPAHVRIKLEEKAREGPAALVRYLDRTRMMGHQIVADEITVARPEAVAKQQANEATQLAEKQEK